MTIHSYNVQLCPKIEFINAETIVINSNARIYVLTLHKFYKLVQGIYYLPSSEVKLHNVYQIATYVASTEKGVNKVRMYICRSFRIRTLVLGHIYVGNVSMVH